MFTKKRRNKLDILHSDYFVLAIGLSIGAIGYLLLAGQPSLRVGVVIVTGLFYILWGILHHAREGDLHMSIILEYVLVASLAIVLLLTLLIRS